MCTRARMYVYAYLFVFVYAYACWLVYECVHMQFQQVQSMSAILDLYFCLLVCRLVGFLLNVSAA